MGEGKGEKMNTRGYTSDTICGECGNALDYEAAEYCEDCSNFFCHSCFKYHDCAAIIALDEEWWLDDDE